MNIENFPLIEHGSFIKEKEDVIKHFQGKRPFHHDVLRAILSAKDYIVGEYTVEIEQESFILTRIGPAVDGAWKFNVDPEHDKLVEQVGSEPYFTYFNWRYYETLRDTKRDR